MESRGYNGPTEHLRDGSVGPRHLDGSTPTVDFGIGGGDGPLQLAGETPPLFQTSRYGIKDVPLSLRLSPTTDCGILQ